MAQLICKRNSVGYNFRSQTDFSLPHVRSVNYGLKTLRYFDPKIGNIVPTVIFIILEHLKDLVRNLNRGFFKIFFVESVKNPYIK